METELKSMRIEKIQLMQGSRGQDGCSGYSIMYDIPTSTSKGFMKLNLTIRLMFNTNGSEGWLMESMSTLKAVLVTTSIL